MPLNDKEAIRASEESPISFRLCGPNERPSQIDQLDDESTSSGDSAVQSLSRKPKRQFTHKEKGKEKMMEYDIDREESDRSESDSGKSKEGPPKTRSKSAERATKLTNQKLR